MQVCLAASFHGERVAARRLARSAQLSTAQALQQILQTVAGELPLADFLAARLRAQENKTRHQVSKRDAAHARYLARRTAKAADPAAWHAWFDGSAVPNPGQLGLGALLQSPEGQRIACSAAGGTGDSNDAEYLALILVLEQALPWQPDALVVHGDSQIVIGDVLGRKAPVASLQAHRLRAQALLAQFSTVRVVWIPRARNGAADALARASPAPVTAVPAMEI